MTVGTPPPTVWGVNHFTPDAVREDIATDLSLLGRNYLDFVYLDDHPRVPFEPIIDAIAREIAGGQLRAFGVRNWTAERITDACVHASRIGAGISAVVTTELALASATRPLWPEYAPFDAALARVVLDRGLAVFAHAEDVNLGQCLYEDADAAALSRSPWTQRWQHPDNPSLIASVREFAAARNLTPREVNLAWVLNQPFPVVALVGLPALLARSAEYERASQLLLDDADQYALIPRRCSAH